MELHKSVGDLVAEDYRRAEVFKKFGIDFCCGGKKSVQEVCRSKGIDRDSLEKELLAAERGDVLPEAQHFNEWEPDKLADYIVERHHSYVKKNIPQLIEYCKKVATVHGNANPEVVAIAELFSEAAHELTRHMMKEERVLFPYIRELVTCKKKGSGLNRASFGTIKNPIRMMEMEHETAGEIFDRIRILSLNYTPPSHACNTYRVEYHKLKEFEEDLHRHVHLENNILFPMAVRMEEELAV